MGKKMSKVLVVTMLVSMICTMAAQAAFPEFLFDVYNTGQTFSNNVYGTTNQKTYAGEEWSFSVSRIYISDNRIGYGIAMRVVNVNTGNASMHRWASQRGSYQGGWYDGGPCGTYKLQGRMDDDLSGHIDTQGYWNADIITNWPSTYSAYAGSEK